jgi:hypothetical protein
MVDLGPCLDEPALSPRKLATDELDTVDGEDADIVLVERVHVWPVVRGAPRRTVGARSSTSSG